MKPKMLFLVLAFLVATLLNAASISGRIMSPEGEGLSNCLVMLNDGTLVAQKKPLHTRTTQFAQSFTDEVGNFTFENLEQGSYFVFASMLGYMDTPYSDPDNGLLRVIEIDADDQEVEGVNIVMIRTEDPILGTGIVRGHLQGSNGVGLEGLPIGIADAANPDSIIPFTYGFSGFDGEYVVGGLFGNRNYVAKVINLYTMESLSAGVAFSTTAETTPVDNIDLTLNLPGYTVDGYFYQTNGDPLPFASVNLMNSDPGDLSVPYVQLYTESEESGYYMMNGVIPGAYKVAGQGFDYWMPIFYPGTIEYANAGVVNVTDAAVHNVNITVPEPQNYIVSGTVTDSLTEQPLANILVQLEIPGMMFPAVIGGPETQTVYTTRTDVNGFYQVAVPVGAYIVSAIDTDIHHITQYYFRTENPYEALGLFVNANVEGINFALAPFDSTQTGSIQGHITASGNADLSNLRVIAVSSDEDWEGSALVDINGNYTINHLHHGSYYVFTWSQTAPPTYYQNTLSWEDAQLVNVNGEVSNINIDINCETTTGMNTVTGTVTNVHNAAVANVTVALQDSNNHNVAFASTNADGQFSLPHLENDNYHVVVTKLHNPTLSQDVVINGNQNLNFVMNMPTANDDATTQPVTRCTVSNYPNPFNPVTTISFNLPKSSAVEVEIYNLKGQKVKTLAHNVMAKGSQKITWNGTNDQNRSVASGVYFCKVKGEGFTASRKMVLMK